METSQQNAVTQMRKSVQKLGFSTEKFGELTLMRFLVARSMDADKAGMMFVQWIKWRKSFVPSGFIDDSEVAEELEQRKIYLQGLSKSGHPLCVIRLCNHVPTKDQLQFKKFVVHVLDKTLASSFTGQEVGNEKLIGVLDLGDLSYKNVDPRGIITGFQMLQSYYPERLAKCYIINMPWFFVSVWRMISRFLDKVTLEKIVIVSNKDEKEAFINEVGAAILPEVCGGKAQLTPVQDFKVAPYEVVTP
ncbi:unnamed protein product [Rhodiola kirilowii]